MTVEEGTSIRPELPREPFSGDRPRGRRDHERNRRRIIHAARELFATADAADVQLKDVAETAGVSQATLFRHIGSKQALITMAYGDRIADIDGAAADAAAADDPWTGLTTFVRTLAQWLHEDRGLMEFTTDPALDAHPRFTAMSTAVDALLDRARESGELRADIRAADLFPLLTCCARAPEGRWNTYADVLLGGLRNPASV